MTIQSQYSVLLVGFLKIEEKLLPGKVRPIMSVEFIQALYCWPNKTKTINLRGGELASFSEVDHSHWQSFYEDKTGLYEKVQ